MAEAIKYGFYAVNPDYLEYLNQIDSEVYTTYHIGTVLNHLLEQKTIIILFQYLLQRKNTKDGKMFLMSKDNALSIIFSAVFRKSSSRLLSDKQAIFLIALHLHIFYEWHHKSSLQTLQLLANKLVFLLLIISSLDSLWCQTLHYFFLKLLMLE